MVRVRGYVNGVERLCGGRSSCRSSPHYDPYENLLCVVEGSKTVKLYPPHLTACFYPYPLWSESHNHSTVHFAKPDLDKHPRYP